MPWRMTHAEIAAAADDVRPLLCEDAARLLRPALRHDHHAIVDALECLSRGTGSVEAVATRTLAILKAAARPGGSADPTSDDADTIWVAALDGLTESPRVASKIARSWYVHGMHLLWDEVQVIPRAVDLTAS